jgi:hypothetical protein
MLNATITLTRLAAWPLRPLATSQASTHARRSRGERVQAAWRPRCVTTRAPGHPLAGFPRLLVEAASLPVSSDLCS